MPGSILATGTLDHVDGGAVLTFAFPVALFVVVAVVLYLRFSRPHKRVPPRQVLTPAHAGAPGRRCRDRGGGRGRPADGSRRRQRRIGGRARRGGTGVSARCGAE